MCRVTLMEGARGLATNRTSNDQKMLMFECDGESPYPCRKFGDHSNQKVARGRDPRSDRSAGELSFLPHASLAKSLLFYWRPADVKWGRNQKPSILSPFCEFSDERRKSLLSRMVRLLLAAIMVLWCRCSADDTSDFPCVSGRVSHNSAASANTKSW